VRLVGYLKEIILAILSQMQRSFRPKYEAKKKLHTEEYNQVILN